MRLTALILPVVIAAATLSPARADDALGLRPGIAPNDNGADGIDTTAPAAKKAAPDDDPYAALGIRAGSFILYPSLTVSSGYTTNAAAAAGGTASPFGTVTPDLVIQSDWARNALTIKLDGSYEKFFDGATADVPTASADATGRIDFAPDWTADLDAGYLYDQQSISDPSYPAGADHPPGHRDRAFVAFLGEALGPVLDRPEVADGAGIDLAEVQELVEQGVGVALDGAAMLVDRRIFDVGADRDAGGVGLASDRASEAPRAGQYLARPVTLLFPIFDRRGSERLPGLAVGVGLGAEPHLD